MGLIVGLVKEDALSFWMKMSLASSRSEGFHVIRRHGQMCGFEATVMEATVCCL